MTSEDVDKKPENTADGKADSKPAAEKTERQGTTSQKPQSAQARARVAKKGVTIDLEAKDITEKVEEPIAKEKVSQSTKTSEISRDKDKSGTGKVDQTTKPDPVKPTSTAKHSTKSNRPSGKPEGPSEKASSKPEVKSERKSAVPISSTKNTDSKKTATPASQIAQGPSSSETRGGGFFSNVPSALLGGVIAICGLIGLQISGILPMIGSDEIETNIVRLKQRIVALEDAANVEVASKAALDGMAERLGGVEEAAREAITIAAEPNVPGEITTRLTALEARLAEAEITASEASKARGSVQIPTGFVERFAAIEARLNAAEENVSKVNNTAPVQQQSDTTAFETTIAALSARVDELATSTANIRSAEPVVASQPVNLTPLHDDIAALDTKMTEFEERETRFDDDIEILATRVDEIAGQIDDQNAATRKTQQAAIALAFDNLKNIAETGKPFARALLTLESAGVSSNVTETLQPYADKGIRDAGSLGAELDRLIGSAAARFEPAVVSGEEPKPLSTLEKFARNARSLIKVRQITDTGQDQSPLNGMRAAFAEGNLDLFTNKLSELQDEQKVLFDQWLIDWKGMIAFSSVMADVESNLNPVGNDTISDKNNSETQ